MKNLNDIENWLLNHEGRKKAKETSFLKSRECLEGTKSLKALDIALKKKTNLKRLQLMSLGIQAIEGLDIFEDLIKPHFQNIYSNYFHNPIYRTSTRGPFTTFLIYRHDKLTINATLIDQNMMAHKKTSNSDGGSIGFHGDYVCTKLVSSGEVIISNWSIPSSQSSLKTDENVKVSFDGYSRYKQGDLILIDSSIEAYLYEYVERPVVALTLAVANGDVSLMQEFDYETKSLLGLIAKKDATSRVQMLLTLIRLLGHKEAHSIIKAYFKENDHFLRWHAMREALVLNTPETYADLVNMAENDEHDDIRIISQRMVEKIDRMQSMETQ